MDLTIRPTVGDDLPDILRIYNHAVMHTAATYDYEPQTLEARAAWFSQMREGGFPVLTAVADGDKVVGWSAAGTFRQKIGYRFTVENSVYVDPQWQGRGIGRALMVRLIEACRERGYHAIVAGIDSESAESILLHESLGFEFVGTFRQVGRKFDRWLDAVFMELLLEGSDDAQIRH